MFLRIISNKGEKKHIRENKGTQIIIFEAELVSILLYYSKLKIGISICSKKYVFEKVFKYKVRVFL